MSDHNLESRQIARSELYPHLGALPHVLFTWRERVEANARSLYPAIDGLYLSIYPVRAGFTTCPYILPTFLDAARFLAPTMAWGVATPQQGAADELLAKATTQRSLCIMPFRRFGADECVALCAGLPGTGVVELLASGHAIGEAGAVAIGQLLAQPSALRRLAVGDASFGDAGAEALLLGLGATAVPTCGHPKAGRASRPWRPRRRAQCSSCVTMCRSIATFTPQAPRRASSRRCSSISKVWASRARARWARCSAARLRCASSPSRATRWARRASARWARACARRRP
jgi:hypothetical protein